jgi:hypothetical protein
MIPHLLRLARLPFRHFRSGENPGQAGTFSITEDLEVTARPHGSAGQPHLEVADPVFVLAATNELIANGCRHTRTANRVAESAIAIGMERADLVERAPARGVPAPFGNRRARRRRDRYTQ